MVDLLPGTALPLSAGGGGHQTEGRGGIELTPQRAPVSLLERLGARDDISSAELAFVGAAIRGFDHRPRRLKTIFDGATGQTDASTGNLVVPLYQCPAGCEAHVALVVADPTNTAGTTPNAGFANTASWAFLAAAQESTGLANANVLSLRPGLFAFAPSPAVIAANAAVVLPFEWTFNDSNAPVLQSGDTLWYGLVGGSQATILNITVRLTYRINLYGFESGQL
jgi:hypothetical protein